MKMLKTAAILVLCNYLWQLAGNLDWMVAAERSYFQIMALLIYAIMVSA